MVRVDNTGHATLWEGNHRTRAAIEAGVTSVPVRVIYEGGSEAIENVWMPSVLRNDLGGTR
jgi:hypothetical protein